MFINRSFVFSLNCMFNGCEKEINLNMFAVSIYLMYKYLMSYWKSLTEEKMFVIIVHL